MADELPARQQQGGELGQQEGHAPSRPTAQPGRAGVEEVRVARKPDPQQPVQRDEADKEDGRFPGQQEENSGRIARRSRQPPLLHGQVPAAVQEIPSTD